VHAYDPAERDAPRFRAHPLRAVLQLTPLGTAVNLLNAAILWWLLAPHGYQVFLAGRAVSMAVAARLGLRGWVRGRHRPQRMVASTRAIRWVTRTGIVLGALWAVLPLVTFPTLAPDSQLLVGMVTTGMICAGGFALSSVPPAAIGSVVVLGLGGMVGIGRWDSLVAEAQADRQNEVIARLLRDFEDHASDLL